MNNNQRIFNEPFTTNPYPTHHTNKNIKCDYNTSFVDNQQMGLTQTNQRSSNFGMVSSLNNGIDKTHPHYNTNIKYSGVDIFKVMEKCEVCRDLMSQIEDSETGVLRLTKTLCLAFIDDILNTDNISYFIKLIKTLRQGGKDNYEIHLMSLKSNEHSTNRYLPIVIWAMNKFDKKYNSIYTETPRDFIDLIIPELLSEYEALERKYYGADNYKAYENKAISIFKGIFNTKNDLNFLSTQLRTKDWEEVYEHVILYTHNKRKTVEQFISFIEHTIKEKLSKMVRK